ncbi:tRNA lysidine(34) synthetase TilS [Marinoscillum sp.]|uniref:tRNA lysidine(34) synthetase TilS n=1 Tax=Marinoscillum sp. TaxID=2024838 RepID=UPI003BACB89D
MYQSFLTLIKENALITRGDKVLIAVSGGVDSMVLAHLMLKSDFRMGVAHVNYRLRGEDSDADEALVRDWCQAHEVPFFLHRVAPGIYDAKESIQMVARNERYTFFDRLCDEQGFIKVATAHNANDNLETVLLNLTKGTGIHGLTGIALKGDRLIRPLLFATKEEVYKYARSEQITWREDVSNQKNDYQRNLIRNEVVPLLKKINPALEATFHDTLLRLQGTARLLQQAVEHRQAVEKEGRLLLNVEWYQGHPDHLVMLAELIKPYGFGFADARDLSGAIMSGLPGKLFYSSTYEINLDRGQLYITSKEEATECVEILVPKDEGAVSAGPFGVQLSYLSGNELPNHDPATTAFFDPDELTFPLKLRRWEQGDAFYPLGMEGKKKVSDFMIDSKIPVTLKKEVLVLESDGRIAWIVGHRIDNRFKITSKTARMLKLEVLRHA